MDFTAARPTHRPAENIVPMINVVFLLLIFFLMTAQITAHVPFEVTPPTSATENRAEGLSTLNISTDGDLFLAGSEGEAIWEVLASAPRDRPLLIRADSGLAAVDLTAILTRLTGMGLTDIALITEVAR